MLLCWLLLSTAVLSELKEELCHEEKHMNIYAQPQYFFFL